MSGFKIDCGKSKIIVWSNNKHLVLGLVLDVSNNCDFIVRTIAPSLYPRKLGSVDTLEFIEIKPCFPGLTEKPRRYAYIKDQSDMYVQLSTCQGPEVVKIIISGVLL